MSESNSRIMSKSFEGFALNAANCGQNSANGNIMDGFVVKMTTFFALAAVIDGEGFESIEVLEGVLGCADLRGVFVAASARS